MAFCKILEYQYPIPKTRISACLNTGTWERLTLYNLTTKVVEYLVAADEIDDVIQLEFTDDWQDCSVSISPFADGSLFRVNLRLERRS